MPFDGSGQFIPLPPPTYPPVAGEVIYAARFISNMQDVFDGLTQCVTRDGQSPMLADLPMNGFRIGGLLSGAAAGQAIEYAQWLAGFTGSTFTDISVNTPLPGSDNLLVPNTHWVQLLLAAAAALNLPPVTGKGGMFLGTDGTTVSWGAATQSFLLYAKGII